MTPEELRAYRAEHGLTRGQVAALLGVSLGTVRNWEQGVRNMTAPSDLALRRMTKAMMARAKKDHPAKRRASQEAGDRE